MPVYEVYCGNGSLWMRVCYLAMAEDICRREEKARGPMTIVENWFFYREGGGA